MKKKIDVQVEFTFWIENDDVEITRAAYVEVPKARLLMLERGSVVELSPDADDYQTIQMYEDDELV